MPYFYDDYDKTKKWFGSIHYFFSGLLSYCIDLITLLYYLFLFFSSSSISSFCAYLSFWKLYTGTMGNSRTRLLHGDDVLCGKQTVDETAIT